MPYSTRKKLIAGHLDNLTSDEKASRTSVLLPNQEHLILFPVVDLQNGLFLNGRLDELPRLDFLRMRKKLVLKVVADILFDEDIITVILQEILALSNYNSGKAPLRSRRTRAAQRH